MDKCKNRKHMLDIVAERLDCTILSDLRRPPYRDAAVKELLEGDFDVIPFGELKESMLYLSPPLKVLLYGTPEDREMLLGWQGDEEHFSQIIRCSTEEEYLELLKDETFELIICMMDKDTGFSAVKEAERLCWGKPMMWFPENSDHTHESVRYNCVLCGMKKQVEPEDLRLAVMRSKEKLCLLRKGVCED